MIVEFLKHLTTPAPKPVKKLGFVAGAIAIEARYKRQHANWKSHLDNSKKIILAEVAKLPAGANILVLGAGCLFDIPYEKILQKGYSISLHDIIFLNSAHKKIRNLNNIEMVESDITAYVEPFFKWMENPDNIIPEPPNPPTLEKFSKTKPQLIISLNLLSQLPIHFSQKAAQLKPDFNFDELANKLMQQHIVWLKAQDCPSLIISDIKHTGFNGEEQVAEEKITITKQLGEPNYKWVWDIAPKGEVHKSMSFKHTVGAWLL